MKNLLMPYLLLGYIFTTTILAAFAFMSIDKAYDPESYVMWLCVAIVINIFCFVYSMLWYADIMAKNNEDNG